MTHYTTKWNKILLYAQSSDSYMLINITSKIRILYKQYEVFNIFTCVYDKGSTFALAVKHYFQECLEHIKHISIHIYTDYTYLKETYDRHIRYMLWELLLQCIWLECLNEHK